MITNSEAQNLIDSVNYNLAGIENLLEQRPSLEFRMEELKKEISDIEDNVKFMVESKSFYIKAVDIMYEESIGALKDTLNTALQYIMFDKNYSCNLELEDKRGVKNLYISLIDNDEDFEVDLKDGAGQGVRTIISFILKTYYLINKSSRLLFLDEKYSALSEHYIPRFFEFMKKMADEKGMIIVLITHDARFMEYADKTYLVNDGHASEQEKEDVLDEEGKDTIGV